MLWGLFGNWHKEVSYLQFEIKLMQETVCKYHDRLEKMEKTINDIIDYYRVETNTRLLQIELELSLLKEGVKCQKQNSAAVNALPNSNTKSKKKATAKKARKK